mmetsp:Transcript_11557/g.17768  ORF Transcript_11557/g.17768 Transcript_11557/m.17768 type:complete len:423 (-) Transcript_11557:394-1662(-)
MGEMKRMLSSEKHDMGKAQDYVSTKERKHPQRSVPAPPPPSPAVALASPTAMRSLLGKASLRERSQSWGHSAPNLGIPSSPSLSSARSALPSPLRSGTTVPLAGVPFMPNLQSTTYTTSSPAARSSMEIAMQEERGRRIRMEKEEASMDADMLRSILREERIRMARFAAELAQLKATAANSQLESEVVEEGRINSLIRQLDGMQLEKGQAPVTTLRDFLAHKDKTEKGMMDNSENTSSIHSTSRSFNLIPFEALSSASISISGTVNRTHDSLSLEFNVKNTSRLIHWPQLTSKPTRKDNLWETTCLEYFVSSPDSQAYWEINLSPSGDWNVYRFDSYRTGMSREMRIGSVELEVVPEQRTVRSSLNLKDLELSGQNLTLGICAVTEAIQYSNGESGLTFWALAHNDDEKADFHRGDSFIFEV